MLENTFRGRKVFNSEWVYGYHTVTFPNARDWKGDLRDQLPQCDVIVSVECGVPFVFPVEISTIGRYTGIEDINGIPIFDGDIVETKSGDKFLVKPNALKGYLMLSSENNPVVIGNIYDNSELSVDLIRNGD